MSDAALDELIARGHALVAALDADDAPAIEAATTAFRAALEPLRSAARDPAKAREALAVTEAARVRVACLADVTRARLARIAAMTGRAPRAQTYGRSGRFVA